jgi:hypothetical protein
MEVVDIGLNDLQAIDISDLGSNPHNGSITGMELLMNTKKGSSSNANVRFGELDSLEKELEDLNKPAESNPAQSFASYASSFLGFGGDSNSSSNNNIKEISNSSNLGVATKEAIGVTKTWDNYSKINDIPPAPERSTISDREKNRKKKIMLGKLNNWFEKGFLKKPCHLNEDSPYEKIEDEYESALADKKERDGVRMYKEWFQTFANTIEYGNSWLNPFDFNLDGLGESIGEDIDSYEDLFIKLHEKYGNVELPVEIDIAFKFAFKIALTNITNKALSSATPGFNDVIRQNPELMGAFTRSTAEYMKKNSPAYSFADNMMSKETPNSYNQPMNNYTTGPPQPPIETKQMPPPPRPGMNYTYTPGSRPDIDMARGAMFREQGVDINNSGSSYQSSDAPPQRKEMKGPQNADIDNLLSGLKPKQPIQVQKQDDSVISISDLKELQSNHSAPKQSKRKPRSEKNTISLDI